MSLGRKINTAIEHVFEKLGEAVAKCPVIVLILNVVILIGLSFGLLNFEVETNIFDLWTPTDSPIFDERDFIDEYWSDKDYGLVVLTAHAKTGFDTNIMETKYLEEWLELHLRLQAELPHRNFTYLGADNETYYNIEFGYFMEDFAEPESLDILGNKSGSKVPGYTSRIAPLCRNFATSPLEAQFQLPCYMFTIFDCFSEGGFLFPYENYLEKTFFENIISTNPYSVE